MSKKQTMIYRVSYSKSRDAFETYFYVGDNKYPTWDDFDFEMSCKCHRAWIEEKQTPTDDACMIHYEVVTRIRQALRLGYKLEFCDRPE